VGGGGRELVVIGRLGRPHGVRGEIAARATGPTLGALEPGAEVVVRPDAGAERRLRFLRRRGTDDRPILAFGGLETREGAAELAGAVLLVPADSLPTLDEPGAHYVRDLIGIAVLVGDRPLGTVAQVHPAPANDVLEVETPAGPVLVPFTADAILELDPDGRRLVLRRDLLPATPPR
jgi:16S rRNA processing protein RimM